MYFFEVFVSNFHVKAAKQDESTIICENSVHLFKVLGGMVNRNITSQDAVECAFVEDSIEARLLEHILELPGVCKYELDMCAIGCLVLLLEVYNKLEHVVYALDLLGTDSEDLFEQSWVRIAYKKFHIQRLGWQSEA